MPTSFNRTARVPEILDSLRQLRARDAFVEGQLREAARKFTNWVVGAIACGFGTFLGLIVASNGIAQFVTIAVLSFLGGVTCAGFAIYWGIQKQNWAAQDVENRRLDLPETFFQVIGRDIRKKTACSVAVDFQGYRKHGELVSKAGGGIFNPITVCEYVDHWFTARGVLADGNRFNFDITQYAKRKEKRKRRYTKVRERCSEEIRLSLRIAPLAYPNWRQLEHAPWPSSIGDLRVTRVRLTPRGLRLSCETAGYAATNSGTQPATTAGLATGDDLLQMMLCVYAQLQAVHPQAASAE